MSARVLLLSALLGASVCAFPSVRANESRLYSDSEMESMIQDRLAHLRFENLQVTALSGMVTLEGTAESLGDKNQARKIAEAAPGVREVFDQLHVVAVPDDVLQQRLDETLGKDVHYTIYDYVEAEAREGEVLLTGQVTLPSDADALAEDLSKVRGARSVTNDVRVLPWSPSDERLREAVATAVYGKIAGSREAEAPVHIVVEGGQVTLHGALGDDRKIEAVAAATRSVPGVVSVENLLTRLEVEMAS